MIKHIVMWKFKDEAEGKTRSQNIEYVVSALTALKAVIPQIRFMEVRGNDGAAENFDAVLITEFESFEALQSYKVNPKHQAVSKYVGKISTQRSCVDYVI